jgi:cytidine deaminase
MRKVNYQDLTAVQKGLLHAANETLDKAYNPYSKFFVGAAVLLSDSDTIFTGVNIENAAYSPCVCAERTAIFSAAAGGHRKFSSMAIIAKPEHGVTKKPTAPCGPCRQVIFEFSQISGIDIEIIMATTDMKEIIISSINELFPMGFGPNDLKE